MPITQKTNPPKKKRITTSSAKAKGRNLQQWAARIIALITNLPYGKDELIASREMGQDGTDIRLVGEAREKFPFSVECKAQEAWSVHSWVEQARKNSTEDMPWIVVAKRSRMNPIVILDADLFFLIIKIIIKGLGSKRSLLKIFKLMKRPKLD